MWIKPRNCHTSVDGVDYGIKMSLLFAWLVSSMYACWHPPEWRKEQSTLDRVSIVFFRAFVHIRFIVLHQLTCMRVKHIRRTCGRAQNLQKGR